jgi:hypothetical protein
MGLGGQCHAPAAVPLGKDPVPIVGGGIYVGNALQQNSELGNLQIYMGRRNESNK